MPKFKIGDTVKIVGGREEERPPRRGEVSTIVKIDDGYVSREERRQVWLDLDGDGDLIGYFAADLDLVESAVQDTPAEPTNVYFVVTTERGQFRSVDYDLNDPETSDAIWAMVGSVDSPEGVAFVSSTGAYVMIPDGKIDSVLFYNLPIKSEV